MRVIMFDIDTLRSDHLGCYGYGTQYLSGHRFRCSGRGSF